MAKLISTPFSILPSRYPILSLLYISPFITRIRRKRPPIIAGSRRPTRRKPPFPDMSVSVPIAGSHRREIDAEPLLDSRNRKLCSEPIEILSVYGSYLHKQSMCFLRHKLHFRLCGFC